MIQLIPQPPLARSCQYGVGWNWWDFLGSGGFYARYKDYPLLEKVHPDPDDEQAWKALEEGLDEIRPGFLRFGLPPDPHVGPDLRFVKGTIHLKRLAKLDQWAQRQGCTILLDTFTMPKAFEFPTPAGTSECGDIQVNMAAADNMDYATRFVVPLLRHVVESGLESVRFFNPINEPMEYGVYQTPEGGPEMYAHYVDMYRQMRTALDEAGIPRVRIGLVGIDGSAITYPLLELFARGLDIDPYVDAYARHFYNLRFDYLPPANGSWTSPISDVIDRQTGQLVRYANHRGKPLLVTEIGTFYYGWLFNNPSGVASIDATLTVAEGVIRGLNIGAECFAFWSLMNPNTQNGHWAALKIQDGKLIRCGHPYTVYGMLSRTIRPGSRVHPLHVSPGSVPCPLHGSLLERPDGSWAALLVNDSPTQNQTIEICLPEGAWTGVWSLSVTDRVRLGEKLPSISANLDQRLLLTLPAFSLVALESQPVANWEK